MHLFGAGKDEQRKGRGGGGGLGEGETAEWLISVCVLIHTNAEASFISTGTVTISD